MEILIGSTNPSKVQSLARRFDRFADVICRSPADLCLRVVVPESGTTMAENALLKARAFHKASGLPVISADSGLYFREFPMEDSRQPGPYIRRVQGKSLTDDEMLGYYSGLAQEFGPLHSCYCNAIAMVDADGREDVYFRDSPSDPDFFEAFGFLLVDQPHKKRNPGWPLDSLSMDPFFQRYWFDVDDAEYHIPELSRREALSKHFNARLDEHIRRFFNLADRTGSE